VQIGAARWSGVALADGTASASVRPERIAFAQQPALAGTVRAKVFQGHHWLLQVTTAAGIVEVIAPNDGRSVPDEGSLVNLAWRGEDMTLTPPQAAREAAP
jgi:putative spermidine/putrescine transport system ATP-binding protein